MTIYKVIETYDGRLPEYKVISQENYDLEAPRVTVLKSFDSLDEAERYCSSLLQTPCGEEDPTA